MEATLIVINDDIVVNWLNVCRVERQPNKDVMMTFADGEAPLVFTGEEANKVLHYFKSLAQSRIPQPVPVANTAPVELPEERAFSDRINLREDE